MEIYVTASIVMIFVKDYLGRVYTLKVMKNRFILIVHCLLFLQIASKIVNIPVIDYPSNSDRKITAKYHNERD